MTLLTQIQKELESIYNITLPSEICVEDYLTKVCPSQGEPRGEVMFVQEKKGTLEVALYIDPTVLNQLEQDRPWTGLSESNLEAFLTVVEGVSHFFTLLSSALSERPISELELELQAEIDKFLLCLIAFEGQGNNPSVTFLCRLLFDSYHLVPSLSDEQRERYELANRLAFRYCTTLSGLTSPHERNRLLREIRRFRTKQLSEKIRALT